MDKELEQLTELRDEHSIIKDSILYLATQQKIEQKVRDALVEIDALVGELDCEGERCDQLKELLGGMNSKRDNKLTVASIVIGALSAVADACISNDGWNKGVAIGAGVIGAGLGWATLSPKGKRLILKHKRNHLRAIWEEKNSDESLLSFGTCSTRPDSPTASNQPCLERSKEMAYFHFRRRNKRSQKIGFV